MKDFIFRIDDIGASTKQFNQHGKKWFNLFGRKILYFPFSNLGFLKRIDPFRGWAKYDELTAEEWKDLFIVFEQNKIKPIIAITANWVDENSVLIPFPEKFPEQAKLLKEAFLSDKIIIANHGLTHCVVGKHLPKFWGSNRNFHREFLPRLDQVVHSEHILKSQEILEGFFEKKIEILVPPGNLWSLKTYSALEGTNIKFVMCNKYMADSDQEMKNIVFLPDSNNMFVFHDRELKLYGVKWLKEIINKFKISV
jgi:hypothetical protein